MKRMVVFICISLLIGCNLLFCQNANPFISFAEGGVIVSSKLIENKVNIPSGENFYVKYDKIEINEMINLINTPDIKGFNLYFSNNVSLDFFKSGIEYISDCSFVEDNQIYYGYCNKYKDFCWVEGKKVNVQIIKNPTGWILGFPLVLTGF